MVLIEKPPFLLFCQRATQGSLGPLGATNQRVGSSPVPCSLEAVVKEFNGERSCTLYLVRVVKSAELTSTVDFEHLATDVYRRPKGVGKLRAIFLRRQLKDVRRSPLPNHPVQNDLYFNR